MHVCRKVYTPDLVCEMVSSRFVHLTIPHFQPGQVEEFDIIIDSPLTAINETLSSIVVSSGSDCPTTLNAFTRHPIDLKHVGGKYKSSRRSSVLKDSQPYTSSSLSWHTLPLSGLCLTRLTRCTPPS
jgi:hypothetical protein